ncbi:hypothetical protein [Propionivibrio limicola]|uniref:hypothetical protein n=1 Tax=Propionivibrio limicola TaxID=167645 RepID=UPI001290C75C|nr:hypothetical protein [Propionivibrio limicola]
MGTDHGFSLSNPSAGSHLGDGAYLHLGKPDEEGIVITVTGVPEVGMAGMNVLLVG